MCCCWTMLAYILHAQYSAACSQKWKKTPVQTIRYVGLVHRCIYQYILHTAQYIQRYTTLYLESGSSRLASPFCLGCLLVYSSVQDEFGWCKSFLFFLTHIGKVSSFNGLSMGHATRFLLHRHRKARKESVNLWKATAFLPFQTLHKLADCPFHACSIRSRRILLVTEILRARTVILLLRVPNLRLGSSGRLRHHWIAMCSTKSCT